MIKKSLKKVEDDMFKLQGGLEELSYQKDFSKNDSKELFAMACSCLRFANALYRIRILMKNLDKQQKKK